MECHGLPNDGAARLGLPYEQPWFTKDSARAMEYVGKTIVISGGAIASGLLVPELIVGAPTEFMAALRAWPQGVATVRFGTTVSSFFAGGTLTDLALGSPEDPRGPSNRDRFDAAITLLLPGPGFHQAGTYDPISATEWNSLLPHGPEAQIHAVPSFLRQFEGMTNKDRGYVGETLILPGMTATAQSGDTTFDALHPLVQSVLSDHVAGGGELPNGGRCGLPAVLSEMLYSGWDPSGADLATVILKGAQRGDVIAPCPGCKPLVKAFDLNYLGEIKSTRTGVEPGR